MAAVVKHFSASLDLFAKRPWQNSVVLYSVRQQRLSLEFVHFVRPIVAQASGLPCRHSCRHENPSLANTLYLMSLHRRRLPHWRHSGEPLFLTWRLHGSLPAGRYPPPKATSAGEAFVHMGRFVDQARSGPTWLRQPDIARLVVDAIDFCEIRLRFHDLDSFVVMPNHVHLLILPNVPPRRLLKSL